MAIPHNDCRADAQPIFVSLHKNDAGILSYFKKFLCRITEKRKQICSKALRRSLCGVALYHLQ